MNPSDQLKTARDLVEVLEQLEVTRATLDSLDTRREQLTAALAGGVEAVVPSDPLMPPEAIKPTPAKPARKTIIDYSSPEDEPIVVPTPEEAEDIYNANVNPASDAQRRMIFGILGTQFGIKDDVNTKAVIVGIIAEMHHGVKLESIKKDLSKAWAKDAIDYLLKAKAKDLEKWQIPF